MHRVITLVWVALIAVSVSAAPAKANDADACKNNSNDTADKAIAACTRLLKLNPKNDVAFNNRGLVYNNKGDYDRAIADYSEAIRLNPKFANPFNNRGAAYNKKGDYDRAIADTTEAIRLNPKFVNPLRHRGYAYSQKGDYDRAIADYSEAIRLDPNDADSRKSLEQARAAKLASAPTQGVVTAQAPTIALATASSPVAVASAVAATAGRRVALVIGNSGYMALHGLRNPRNDAADMAAALTALGFEVTPGIDLNRDEMEEAASRRELPDPGRRPGDASERFPRRIGNDSSAIGQHGRVPSQA